MYWWAAKNAISNHRNNHNTLISISLEAYNTLCSLTKWNFLTVESPKDAGIWFKLLMFVCISVYWLPGMNWLQKYAVHLQES